MAEQGNSVMFVCRQDVCGFKMTSEEQAGLGEKGCEPCEET